MSPYLETITKAIRKRGIPFGISMSGNVIVGRIDTDTHTLRPVFILSKGMVDCYMTYPHELYGINPAYVESVIAQANTGLLFGEMELNEKTEQLSFFSEYRIPKTFEESDRLSLELFLNYFLDKMPGLLSRTLSLISTGTLSQKKKNAVDYDAMLARIGIKPNE